jgi:UDP:flavonoid glycosyltransferase YjiC (YdhE family)
MKDENIAVVIVGFGTKGDVYPLIAIANELTARGIDAHFISTNNYKSEINESGATFFCASEVDEYSEKIRLTSKSIDPIDYDHIFKSCIIPTFHATYCRIEEIYRSNQNLIVIRLGVNNGAHLACEKLNLPYFEVALSPIWLQSCYDPGWPLNQLALPIRYVITKFSGYWNSRRHPYLQQINNERQKVGLPRVSSMNKLKMKQPELIFAMFPAWFGMPQVDWPKNISVLNFPLQDKIDCRSRKSLDSFIHKNFAPLVFTLGSEMFNCEVFFQIAYKVCKRLGISGVFINPLINEFDLPDDASILKIEYIDFGYLFSKSKVVIHHGGIGTCAQAFLAGKPQVVCPLQYDQPDNGWRISKLGVGGMITKDQINETNLSAMIKEILDSEPVHDNANTYSSLLRQIENPISQLVDKVLEYTQR